MKRGIRILKILKLCKKKQKTNCNFCEGVCNEKCLPEVIDEIPEESIFYLSESQNAKFMAWKRTKKLNYIGPIGGHFSIEFMLTGIGEFVKGKCMDGTSIDLTEYNKL
jgi:hypothetical protein